MMTGLSFAGMGIFKREFGAWGEFNLDSVPNAVG